MLRADRRLSHQYKTVIFGLSTLFLFLGLAGIVFGMKGNVVLAANLSWTEVWCAKQVIVGGNIANSNTRGAWWKFGRRDGFTGTDPGQRCIDGPLDYLPVSPLHEGGTGPVSEVTWLGISPTLAGVDQLQGKSESNAGFVTEWTVLGQIGTVQ